MSINIVQCMLFNPKKTIRDSIEIQKKQYVKDFFGELISDFLNLPIDSVNNRFLDIYIKRNLTKSLDYYINLANLFYANKHSF